jgi:hypothetical protein
MAKAEDFLATAEDALNEGPAITAAMAHINS